MTMRNRWKREERRSRDTPMQYSAVPGITSQCDGGIVEYLSAFKDLALELLYLCVFRLGLLQDGDVGVGVFPEREEILIGGAGFGCVAL
jgi:hypothetical protein